MTASAGMQSFRPTPTTCSLRTTSTSPDAAPRDARFAIAKAEVSARSDRTIEFRPERQCHTRFAARSQCRRSGSTEELDRRAVPNHNQRDAEAVNDSS
jgi:hypothetical protein